MSKGPTDRIADAHTALRRALSELSRVLALLDANLNDGLPANGKGTEGERSGGAAAEARCE